MAALQLRVSQARARGHGQLSFHGRLWLAMDFSPGRQEWPRIAGMVQTIPHGQMGEQRTKIRVGGERGLELYQNTQNSKLQ